MNARSADAVRPRKFPFAGGRLDVDAARANSNSSEPNFEQVCSSLVNARRNREQSPA
jgi:hypothetical protein